MHVNNVATSKMSNISVMYFSVFINSTSFNHVWPTLPKGGPSGEELCDEQARAGEDPA